MLLADSCTCSVFGFASPNLRDKMLTQKEDDANSSEAEEGESEEEETAKEGSSEEE